MTAPEQIPEARKLALIGVAPPRAALVPQVSALAPGDGS